MARDYKQEYRTQKARGEHENRMERQRARRKFDAENGRSARNGKDLSHRKALSQGGSNADGVRLESPSTNRARNYRRKKKKD
jgi:hypothetical protein